VDANTPPPDGELVDGPPEEAAPDTAAEPTDSTSAIERNYEVGREVAVTSKRAGDVVKLSVAVAVSNEALAAASPMTAEQLEELVSAAVGADPERGDTVRVVVSAFESVETPEPAFWEQPWFMPSLRYGSALLAVLLAILFVVRPLMKKMRRAANEPAPVAANPQMLASDEAAGTGAANYGDLPQRVQLARQLAASQPDRAVEALQRMLEPQSEGSDAPRRA
jgi:flagellar M-ring protein FliF